MIWSELLTNSIKSNVHKEDLNISISLSERDGVYEMAYRDTGIGYPHGRLTPAASGIGSIIIDSLVRQLAAKSRSFNDEGAHFVISFKEKTLSPL